MKLRTGKECKKINCKNYPYYSRWAWHLGSAQLTECTNCKNAHVSQYKSVAVKKELE
jgi:hypothetical protein